MPTTKRPVHFERRDGDVLYVTFGFGLDYLSRVSALLLAIELEGLCVSTTVFRNDCGTHSVRADYRRTQQHLSARDWAELTRQSVRRAWEELSKSNCRASLRRKAA